MIHDPDFAEMDQWQVQKQASIQVFANVYVYSKLTDQQLEEAMLNPTSNIEETLKSLEKSYGRPLTIGVMPQGPLTIPYVES
jgi:nickel-dependent lactate racemase